MDIDFFDEKILCYKEKIKKLNKEIEDVKILLEAAIVLRNDCCNNNYKNTDVDNFDNIDNSILCLLGERGQVLSKDIAAFVISNCDCDKKTVYKRLSSLKDDGKISCEKVGRFFSYSPMVDDNIKCANNVGFLDIDSVLGD